MHFGKVEICGVNTAKLPLLKQEEKEKLIETSHETEEEKRTRKSNENIIDSSSEGEKDLTEIQNKLSKLAEENQMLEDDIKGILLDTSL